MLCFSLWLPVR